MAEGAIAGAITRAAIDLLKGHIEQSDDPEKTWEMGVRECIDQAQMSFEYHYRNTKSPNFDRLARDIDRIGKSAHELAFYGQKRNFDTELTEWIQEFARACSDYANAPSINDYRYENEFEASLAKLGTKIRNKTDEQQ